MRNIFTVHPRSIGETYLQHLKFALIFGIKMLIGGIACIIHAVFPFLFQHTGSNILIKMVYFFVERMPKVEERILLLAQIIEKKQADNKN
jgi:hypothetical protein